MTIRQWPRLKRSREKLLDQGPETLSDAELLALFLGSGIADRSAVDLARRLLLEFGSLSELMSADSARCLRQAGLGPARYALLKGAFELSRRHSLDALCRAPALGRPEALRAFLLAQLRGKPHESLACLHLDSRHQLIAFEEIFRGTLERASVHPREIVRRALANNSAAVIMAHYHPKAVTASTVTDAGLTRDFKESLALIDVRLLDHFLLGGGACISFAERKLL